MTYTIMFFSKFWLLTIVFFQKTKRQAALILVAYLTFWTPYNVLAIFNAFSPKDGALREIASVTLPFLNSMIVMNPIVNPLIYGLFDRHKRSFSNGHSTQTTWQKSN